MRIKLFAMVFLAYVFAAIGLAQKIPDAEMAHAAAIENSVERLAAYDALATKHKLTKESTSVSASAGNWQLREDVSPIDDTRSVSGYLEADAPQKIGYRTITPTLIVRYKEKKLSAFINYGAFMGSDTVEVTIRYGKEEPMTQEWDDSTDHKAIFAPGDGAYLVRKIKEVPSFVVRVTPYGESPVTASFSTAGIEALMAKINEAVRVNGGAVK
jgi:type VI secretion system protein VasI